MIKSTRVIGVFPWGRLPLLPEQPKGGEVDHSTIARRALHHERPAGVEVGRHED
jgi:hypothetical protein